MPTRNELLGRVHAAAKVVGLDEDAYRDMLEGLTGKRSAKNCSDAELSLVLNTFHMKRPGASFPHHAKIKALFIAAYNLGALAAGTDAALDAFCRRQTGKERLTFITPAESRAVIEPLKDMLRRDGVADGDLDGDGMQARRALLVAQWLKLHRIGAVRIGDPAALNQYLSKKYLTYQGSTNNLTKVQLDDCARALGRWIRDVQAKRSVA
jgi:hypothetical protein